MHCSLRAVLTALSTTRAEPGVCDKEWKGLRSASTENALCCLIHFPKYHTFTYQTFPDLKPSYDPSSLYLKKII